MSRALVLQGGTMRGAFLVGVLKTIYYKLGVSYFDAIFATSVGVFEQAFFASSQPEMENTWREYVHGRQLINMFNPLWGRPILDLDYLIDLFQTEKSLLNVERLKSSHPQLFVLLADYKTRQPKVFDMKKENVFDLMRAACALPIVYPWPAMIRGERYVDSLMTPAKIFGKFLDEQLKNFDEVLAVSAYCKEGDPRLGSVQHVLRPTHMPLWGALDTNRARIIKTIEQGERDTEEYLKLTNTIQASII